MGNQKTKMTDIVKLNVSGTILLTRKMTLNQFKYFRNIFERWTENESNELFVDSDPELFRHLLNLVKIPEYEIPESIERNVFKLIQYYELENVKIKNRKQKKIYLYEVVIGSKMEDVYEEYEFDFDNLLELRVSFNNKRALRCSFLYDNDKVAIDLKSSNIDLLFEEIISSSSYSGSIRYFRLKSVFLKYFTKKIKIRYVPVHNEGNVTIIILYES